MHEKAAAQTFNRLTTLASISLALGLILPTDGQSRELWGFIDTSGKFIIPPKYREVESFFQGSAQVLPAGADENDPAQWKQINKPGTSLSNRLIVKYDDQTPNVKLSPKKQN